MGTQNVHGRRSSAMTVSGIALIFLVTVCAPVALADTTGFDLGAFNQSGFPGPYVHVDITRTDSTHATITFSSLVQSGFTYRIGGPDGGGVNVALGGGTVGVSNIAFNGTATATCCSTPPPQQMDGFGTFNTVLRISDGFTGSGTSLSYLLTLTGATTTWASASDVLTGNEGGSLAAAKIFVAGASCGTGACTTGFVANGTPVPEPGTLALFGSGLVSVGALLRKRLFSRDCEEAV